MNFMNGESRGKEADANVLEVLRAARMELDTLLRQRAEITRQIGTVKQAIIGLANVFGGPTLQSAVLELMDHRTTNRQSGFTRACRYVLTEANRPLNSSEMCEELRKKFPEVASRHKDPTASVTTVLNRLVAYGEAVPSKDSHGRRAWQWVADEKWTGVVPMKQEPGVRRQLEN
jgi:hypothetical protein